jgi:AcrR family transcriptional regulator
MILDGARAAFARHGYERASMDLVAARAGVSKATLYNHFEDKRALFADCYLAGIAALRARIARVFESQTGDPVVDLQRVGEHLLEVLLASTTVELHRVLMAEAIRFPDLGRALWEHCACTMTGWLAGYLERQHASGVLRVEEPELAARQFLALCQVDLVTRRRLGIAPRTTEAERRASVAHAVRTFMRAHRP